MRKTLMTVPRGVQALLRDERGFILSAELVLILTLGVLAMVVGVHAVAKSLNGELIDIAQSFGNMNQSFFVHGFSYYCPRVGLNAATGGSGYIDGSDYCDCAALTFNGPGDVTVGGVTYGGVVGSGVVSRGGTILAAPAVVPGPLVPGAVAPGIVGPGPGASGVIVPGAGPITIVPGVAYPEGTAPFLVPGVPGTPCPDEYPCQPSPVCPPNDAPIQRNDK